LVIKLVFKISYHDFDTKISWLLNINYLDFGYQNDLVSKLVSN